jgi:hypothetical protein
MSSKRDFPGRRWLNISLRSLHLAGVVLAGAGIFGNGAHSVAGLVLMLLTGFGLYGLELWHHLGFWREIAGLLTPVKLLLLLAMLLVPDIAMMLFWVVLIASSVVSHAPWEFRHRTIGRAPVRSGTPLP